MGNFRKDPSSGKFVAHLTEQERREHRRRSVARYNAKRARGEAGALSPWEWQLWHKYGLSKTDYYELLEFQGGGCAVCGASFGVKIKGRRRKLYVDHDHATGAVRGILCFRCNVVIAAAEKSSATLTRLLEYIQDPPFPRYAEERRP